MFLTPHNSQDKSSPLNQQISSKLLPHFIDVIMSLPWNITQPTRGDQCTLKAWKKDTREEKEAERWWKIKEGQKVFSLLVGKDGNHDEITMDIEDDGAFFINKLKLEEKER
jgi:hypothetical protein